MKQRLFLGYFVYVVGVVRFLRKVLAQMILRNEPISAFQQIFKREQANVAFFLSDDGTFGRAAIAVGLCIPDSDIEIWHKVTLQLFAYREPRVNSRPPYHLTAEAL
jgi:hypothetical protein